MSSFVVKFPLRLGMKNHPSVGFVSYHADSSSMGRTATKQSPQPPPAMSAPVGQKRDHAIGENLDFADNSISTPMPSVTTASWAQRILLNPQRVRVFQGLRS